MTQFNILNNRNIHGISIAIAVVGDTTRCLLCCGRRNVSHYGNTQEVPGLNCRDQEGFQEEVTYKLRPERSGGRKGK